MNSTITSPGTELATQQLHIRQLFMQNQSTWPRCTQWCENVWHVSSIRPAPLVSNNWSTTICFCPETEVSGWTSRCRDMASHICSNSWIIYSRPYRSFFCMFGKSEKVTGVFIYRRNKSWYHISLLLTDKTFYTADVLKLIYEVRSPFEVG